MSEKGEKIIKATPSGEKQAARPASPTPTTTPATLAVPAASIPAPAPSDGRSTRSSSPSGLPAELICKSRTQLSRIEMLKTMVDHLPETLDETSYDEVVAYLQQAEELHKTFQKEHAYLEVTWPSAHVGHDYFTGGWFDDEMTAIFELRRRLNKFKAAFAKIAGQEQLASSDAGAPRRVRSKLPEITLPPFSGRYEDWPAFRDLFTSLIIENEQLSNVERLHYLRSCLRGDTTHVVSNLPFTDDSFPTAWANMKQRFENKRIVLQSILDKLHSTPPVHQKSSTTLHNLAANLLDITSALRSLGPPDQVRDFMVVHQISRSLDKATQKEWEIFLGEEEDIPKPEKLDAFLRAKARGFERVEPSTTSTPQTTQPKPTVKKTALTVQARKIDRAIQQSYGCDCCEAEHFIISCPEFRAMSIQERRRLVDKLSLCRNCCGRHATANCKSMHRFVASTSHSADQRFAPTVPDQRSSSLATQAELTLLATANAQVISSTSVYGARLLVDAGSELSFVSEDLVDKLGLQRTQSTISITGIGGKKSTQTRGIVCLNLQPLYNTSRILVQAHVLRTLTTILPSCELSHREWPHLNRLKLADPEFFRPRSIDIIIGADHYGRIIKPNLVKGSPSMPIAQLSIFGWLVIGPASTSSARACSSYNTTISQDSDASLRELLTKFWVQEELPADSSTQLTPEEEECENHFRATHTRDSTGRYVVRIPLKSSPKVLGNSYSSARACLRRTLGKLARNPEYRELYLRFMKEYEDLGHMKKASSISPNDSSIYYLPHHGVFKPDSTSTKLRVVFNGSRPTTTGLSVNDIMHTGANLLLNISDVLLWIRHHKCIFATDITKMYRQVRVHEDDWNLQRILWIDEDSKEVPYTLTTVTYGTKAAPFLAVRALLQLAEDEGHRYPLAVPSIKHARYVDDIFGGADSLDALLEIASQLTDLCTAGGFPLAKWHSNEVALLQAFVPSTQSQSTSISLDDCNTKILGLRWNSLDDSFTFSSQPPNNLKITKRLVLSEVAQIFDPLGFLSPVTIRAKVLLQELWLHKLNWDEPLPSHITTRWNSLREDLTCLARLSIPRWFNTYSNSTIELHGFSDASQLAMAAVIYITVISPSTELKVTSLVCSKTKVAPLKTLTIPRLELTAALMLSKLMKYVQANLKLNIAATYLWTDSQVTLTWIRSHASRWKDYVRNRVTQIQELTHTANWRHVPGTSNPADCASRGLTTAQLEQHRLWWRGPPWLSRSSESWPIQTTQLDDTSLQECRPGISNVLTIQQIEYHWDLIYKYSSLLKLFTITSVCFRFISKLRKSVSHSSNSPADLERARIFWIKATQSAYFASELKMMAKTQLLPSSHVFNRLTAFIDDQGVIRVGGRLNYAPLTYEGKHPAILPRHSRLSDLIVDHSHKATLHGGTQLTLAHIRQTYWIIGGRAPVRSHILRCVVCARQRGIRAHQLMGQLPLSRVTPSHPFSHTGIDYAGPITLKTWKGRGAKTQKAWICVFVCMTTSAVHLEMVSDYSTDGFIATYRRFTARRGIPHSIYSDCGTNFIGAEATLRSMFVKGTQDNQRLAKLFVNDNTTWNFNPPAAPHMGGKWEAVVKSIKYHLRRTVSDTVLTFEEYTTLLNQIEATLNSRPLEPLTDDPDDISVLTPAHFLIGRAISTLPEPSIEQTHLSPRARWHLIQQKLQHFWRRWSAQHLQRMQSISKWHHPSNNIKIGSLVLLTDERFPPCKWPLARVLEVHPGPDGLTRVVTIKTATTTLTRPIAKLVVLPVTEAVSSSSSASC